MNIRLLAMYYTYKDRFKVKGEAGYTYSIPFIIVRTTGKRNWANFIHKLANSGHKLSILHTITHFTGHFPRFYSILNTSPGRNAITRRSKKYRAGSFVSHLEDLSKSHVKFRLT